MIPTAENRRTAIASVASSTSDILSPMAWAMMVTVTRIQKPTVVPILRNIASMLRSDSFPILADIPKALALIPESPANLRIKTRVTVKTYKDTKLIK